MTDRTCPLTSAEQMTETTWAILRLRMIAGADDGSRIGDLLALDLIGGAA